MERVLNPPTRARRTESPAAATPVALLAPGAAPGEWDLVRPLAEATAGVTHQTFSSLEAAALGLTEAEPFVLALPLSLGLVQRLTLPPAAPAELEDMARIQLEKILPYPVESVGIALTEIARNDSEVTVAVDTVRSDRLAELCRPLVDRGAWPLRVMFHARMLAAGAAADATEAFVCREEGRSVLGVCEGGKLGFARAVDGDTASDLAAELPAVLLGAELEGVPTNFGALSLDRRVDDWAGALGAAVNVPVETFDTARTALLAAGSARGGSAVAGDLAPASWRTERLRGERSARLRRRLLLGLGLYLAALGLAFVGVGVLWVRERVQRAHLERLQAPAEYSENAMGHWRTLAPAIDPSRYVAETMRPIYECLPADSTVLWTGLDLTPRTISIQGEAPTPSSAVDFIDKLRARSELRKYHFEAEPPTTLPNGRTRFLINGTLPDK